MRRRLLPLLPAARPSPGYAYELLPRIWVRDRGRYRLAKEKLAGLRDPLPLPGSLLYALQARQEHLWRLLSRRGGGLALRLQALTPFTTGLGEPHPVEVGFAFLKPYGIPYLPGSGLKGALRATLRREIWSLTPEARHEGDELLFGNLPGREPARRGILIFLDLLPEQAELRLDVMNPHYTPYYQGREAPTEWQEPNPVPFLTVAAGSTWRVRLLWAPPSVRDLDPSLRADLLQGLARLLCLGGVGAKTSAGYGLFRVLAGDGLTAEELAFLQSAAAWAPAAPPAAPPHDLEDHPLLREARRVDASRMPHFYAKLTQAAPPLRDRALAVIREKAKTDKSLRRHLRRYRDRYPLLAEEGEG